MAFEDGPRQIIEIATTGFTMVSLAMLLRLIEAMFVGVLAAAERTPHPLGPAQLSNFFKATRIVDEILNFDQSHSAAVLGAHVPFLQGFSPQRPYVNLPTVYSQLGT